MITSGPEGFRLAGQVVDDSVATAEACRLCLDRAFGTIALGPKAEPGAYNDAMEAIRGAEGVTSFSTFTRATIYRCTATECSRAAISFTQLSSTRIPDPENLNVEALPGTCECVISRDVMP